MCDRIPARRQLVVNTTSASGGSVAALERPGRAVIAATKSGTEKNATVFARYWVEALQDPAADTDKSDSISAMEAFTYAAKKTAAFYDSQKRLATEHAVFDDMATANRCAKPATDKGSCCRASPCCAWAASLQARNDPAKRALLAEEGGSGTEDRHAEISEGRDGSRGLQEAADRRAGGVGEGAGGAGQMRAARHLSLCCCSVPQSRARRCACRLLVAAQARASARKRKPALKR